jgi:flagellar hook-length control protein FliK
MTSLNVIAAAITIDLPSAPSNEQATSDGAAFGAMLDHVMSLAKHVAGAANHVAKPAQRSGSANSEIDSVHHLFQLAPVEESTESEGPSLSEIALPIESMSAYLAAFIALFAQTMAPDEAAEATAEAVASDDFTIAALGVSIAQNSTGGVASLFAQNVPTNGTDDVASLFAQNVPTNGADDISSLFAPVATSDEGADSSLTELFTTLLEGADDDLALQIADRASEGANLRELVNELAASLAQAQVDGESRVAAQTNIPARAELETSARPVQSLGQLVEALTQLTANVREGGGNEQVAAAVAAVTTVRSDDASFERLFDDRSLSPRVEVPETVAQVAQLVANLTREIGAAARPLVEIDESGAAPLPATPQIRETTMRVVMALAESAQTLQVAQMSGKSQVTIQLEPESLGKVTIEVERTSEGVVARVAAATPEAERAIAANAGSVREALAGIGIAVTKIEVSGPSTVSLPKGFEAVLAAVAPTAPRPEQSSPVDGSAESTNSPVEMAVIPEDQAASDTSNVATTSAQPQIARAEGPTPQAAPVRTGVASLVRDIADQAGVLIGQGKSDFQIQLRPESLGRLQIRMTMEAGEVSVQMRAESAQAKSAIESNLAQLKQSFQEQGIRVDRFEVVVAQGQLAQEHGHPRRSRGWVDEVRRRPSNRDEGEFAGALAAAVRPVDYRA